MDLEQKAISRLRMVSTAKSALLTLQLANATFARMIPIRRFRVAFILGGANFAQSTTVPVLNRITRKKVISDAREPY